MKKNLLNILLISVLLMLSIKLSAQATGFGVSIQKCNALKLTWTSSKACIVIAKQGSLPDFIPANNTSYTAINHFNLKGKSAPVYGTNCYIVANSSGVNAVTIDSLKPCTDYYFTIYQHDNNGSSTQYDTASSRIKVSTYCLNLAFEIKALDSCETHNEFQFKNTSTTTLPSVSYSWDFGDGQIGSGQTINHIYSFRSGKITVQLKSTNSLDCENSKMSTINIYPKKVAILDASQLINPQCLSGNYYEVDIKPIASPLAKSLTFNWQFGDGDSSSFKKTKHRYRNGGQFPVMAIIKTYVNLKPTGCSDTLRFIAFVRQGPDAKITSMDSVQCLAGNAFSFKSNYFYKTKNQWDFGDGNYDTASLITHHYNYSTTYIVVHTLLDSNLCADTFSFAKRTLDAANSNFSGLDTSYCAKSSVVKLIPISPFGQFFGYPVSNNLLIPDSVGTYQLKYTLRLKNCSDSTTKNFIIKSSCSPSIGANRIITNSETITLDAGAADYYLWNTSDTTQTISVAGSKLTPGSNTFIVNAYKYNGCSGADTIIIGLDYFSNLKNTTQHLFKIYPNPVNSTLHLNPGIINNFEWRLYNLEGKTLAKGNQTNQAIDLSQFDIGLYFIELISGQLKESYKISKQ